MKCTKKRLACVDDTVAGKNLKVYWAVGLLLMDFSSHLLQEKN